MVSPRKLTKLHSWKYNMKTLMRLYLFTNAILRYREKQKSYLGISIFFQTMSEMSNVLMNSKERGHTYWAGSLGGCYGWRRGWGNWNNLRNCFLSSVNPLQKILLSLMMSLLMNEPKKVMSWTSWQLRTCTLWAGPSSESPISFNRFKNIIR